MKKLFWILEIGGLLLLLVASILLLAVGGSFTSIFKVIAYLGFVFLVFALMYAVWINKKVVK